MKPSSFYEQTKIKQQNERLTKKHKSKKGEYLRPHIIKNNSDIIFDDNIFENLSLEDQVKLFSEIIIDIYFQNEKHYEKRNLADGS